MKKLLVWISTPFVYLMKPFKIFAYTTNMGFLKRLILGITAFFDFIISWIHGQNETMVLHEKVFGGNFIFGTGVMKTDYHSMVREIQQPSLRTNHFMGIPVVSNNAVFVVNSPMISLGEPFRSVARQYINETIFTPEVMALTYEDVKTKCAVILSEWLEDDKPSSTVVMRSVTTRMTILLCQDILITKKQSEDVTGAYLRRFLEISLFKRYLPIITGLLGSEKRIKSDAFYPLRQAGVSNPVIDATLFAAMFSIGTLFGRCVGDIKKHKIDFDKLSLEERKHFVMESLRLYPTVTTTHRMLDEPEEVIVAGRTIQLAEGDEIVYPFVCGNTDASAFKCPYQIDVNRDKEEYQKNLSWSKGAHACPAQEMSVLITLTMLDTLHSKTPLATVDA